MESPRDTSKQDPLLTLAMAWGNPDGFIADQERQGQAEIVRSAALPTDMGDRAAYRSVGFAFGERIEADPLFTSATLPDGWTRRPTDHAMWSSIVDELGRERVGVFYKAAFYDRKAHMALVSVSSYARRCLYEGHRIVLDESWATREACIEALSASVTEHETQADDSEWLSEPRRSEYVAEHRAKAAAARATLAELEAAAGGEA